jgi:hypothetical protein
MTHPIDTNITMSPTAEETTILGERVMSEIPVCACGEKNIDQCMCSCDGVVKRIRDLCDEASSILEMHGISISMPWNGTLDDLEIERFRGLLAAVNHVRSVERKRCAYIASNACLVLPDGGSPTEEERLVCEEAARRIMGEA